MQLQTFFAIISLQTTMRDFFLSLLSLAFYHFLLLAEGPDAWHQLCQSSSCVYLIPHRHSLLLSQQTVAPGRSIIDVRCDQKRLKLHSSFTFSR